MVLSSLLVAASVAGAGPNDKTDKKAAPTTGSAGSGSAAPTPAANAGSAAPAIDPATVPPSDMPTAVRMRRLEQKTQALKERAWQLKARVQMLKEQMLGGGVGAQALIAHASEMGASFRLIKLIYTLDGTQIFVRTDETGESLYKTKGFDVFAGPISPGNHNVLAAAVYRGHGYGVFEYLSKYTFTANGTQAFTATEGKVTKVDCKGFEKGGPTTPLEKRAALECKVTTTAPEKAAADKPAAPATPAPAPTTTPTTEPGK
ncbi:MAG: dihydrolipoamide acetyltransferase [Deltaproteobacteria bacterium]|nr:dihydrolipoamide acetyltransferase [Deltaproteobacteria bacterium]